MSIDSPSNVTGQASQGFVSSDSSKTEKDSSRQPLQWEHPQALNQQIEKHAQEIGFAPASQIDSGVLKDAVNSYDQKRDLGFEVQMALMLIFQMLIRQRLYAQKDALAAAKQALDEGMSVAEHMRESAFYNLAGGVLGGTLTIAGGLSTISGMASASKSTFSEGEETPASAAKFQGKMAKVEAGTKLIDGVSQIVQSGLQYQARMEDAKSQEDKSLADQFRAYQDSERDFSRDFNDFMHSMMDIMGKMIDADNQASSRITA